MKTLSLSKMMKLSCIQNPCILFVEKCSLNNFNPIKVIKNKKNVGDFTER